MFATLVGPYPRTRLAPTDGADPSPKARRGAREPAAHGRDADELVREVLAEQIDAGLGMLTDGHARWEDAAAALAAGLDGLQPGSPRVPEGGPRGPRPRAIRLPEWRGPILVAAWRFAATAATELAAARGVAALPVKACLVGPYTLARRCDPGTLDRRQLALALAEALRQEIGALLAAGAPVVQVDEDALTSIGRDDGDERALAADALRRLTDGLDGAHLSLAITGGDAEGAGPGLLFDLPFRSYLFDLVAGPDNWRLVTHAPTDRGVIVGVADARSTVPDDEPVMVWGARYAAASNARGLDRVGLAPSAGMEQLPRAWAKRKIERLAAAASLAGVTDGELLRGSLDPRAVDARSAALGRYEPEADRSRQERRAQR